MAANNQTLSDAHMAALEARGLDIELALKHSLRSGDGGELVIPFLRNGAVVGRKMRTLTGEKKFWQEADSEQCFWNVDILYDQTLDTQPLVIAEGEPDALAAIQAGYVRTMSVPNGASAKPIGAEAGAAKYAFLDAEEERLRAVTNIVIASDGDSPGANLLNDLSLRLGKARCRYVRYPRGCKDLGDVLREHGVAAVQKCLDGAPPVRVDGIYRMSEIPPEPPAPAFDIGMPALAPHYRLRLGDFCVVTGCPGHGKSTWLTCLAAQMADLHGWTTAFASFEQSPTHDHRRALRTWHGQKQVRFMSNNDIDAADDWIDQRFVFITPGDDEPTLDWLFERMEVAVLRYGAQMIAIDPWNELDHRRDRDTTQTEYVSEAIKAFKRFARKFQVHLIVAAHPAKLRRGENGAYPVPGLYDISDSAHWANKADVGIVVHRENYGSATTHLLVAKSRYHDEIGRPGEVELVFHPDTGRFSCVEPEMFDAA